MRELNHQLKTEIVAMVDEKFPVSDGPGLALMVYADGAPVFEYYKGVADLKFGTPISRETNFRLASVSKQFTAAAILLLIKERMFGLDDRITKFFHDFPTYGKAITVRNLLCHTSGLKDYENFVEDEPKVFPVDKDVVEILKQQTETDFVPGEVFRYNNSGYAVLAEIVEKVSRVSFPEFLKQRFFIPLGMEKSIVHVASKPDSVIPNRAMGHVYGEGKKPIEKDFSSTSFVLGDGGVYSSIADYSKWLAGLDNGEILGREVIQSMIKPQDDNSGREIPYGFGWRLAETENGWQPYHPGGTTGFNNCVRRRLDHGFTVAVFGNLSQWGATDFAQTVEKKIIKYLAD